MKAHSLGGTLQAALERRAQLQRASDTNCYRLINGDGDGCPGVTVDWFAGVAILSLYRDMAAPELHQWTEALAEQAGPRAVFVKRRVKGRQALASLAPEQPVYSPGSGSGLGSVQEEEWVLERGLRFLIQPGQGLAVGLYLDAREARGWVERVSSRARVLNLFAYTCGFGLAAARGGATSVLNVDLSRRVLDWGRRNAEENRQIAQDFAAQDVFQSLKRLARQGKRFEVVVADPPSFSSSHSGVFSADKDFARLATACAQVTAPGGRLFALCNQASLEPGRFEAKVRQGVEQAGRRVGQLERGEASPVDFPLPPGQPGGLKVLCVSLD